VQVNIDPRVYNESFYPYLDDQTETQIFFGGARSGKSVFLAMRVLEDLLKGGRNYLILRNVGKDCRYTFNEIKDLIYLWGLNDLFKITQAPLVITCGNGFQALFRGLDDVQKVKSIKPDHGIITDIWVEEATETQYHDIKELEKRLGGLSEKNKRIIMSFNPIIKAHWIYEQYFDGRFNDEDRLYTDDKLVIHHSTYKDNRFLTQQDRDRIENETDEYYYAVYALGHWGVLGNVIFTNWKVEDLSDIRDQMGTYRNGLDFGFTNDPTALARFAIRDKKLYITHGFYEYGLTNPDIADMLRPVIGSEYVYCDSAEPKSIEELRYHGINAEAADKPKGSVNHGIQLLKQYEIIIDKGLQFAINEFQTYQWKKNRDGISMNVPVDRNNHFIDALRYGMCDLLESGIRVCLI